MHDRETGRPKGFGFCEFTDPAMAEAAIRNFQGYELNGRPLRVDSAAASDRNVEEVGPGGRDNPFQAQQMQMAVQAAKEQIIRVAEESPYGKEPEQGKAPEQIARTVSSLPPENMFMLMKQMKHMVTTNPGQLRQFLSENPQMAYALLQVRPRTALQLPGASGDAGGGPEGGLLHAAPRGADHPAALPPGTGAPAGR